MATYDRISELHDQLSEAERRADVARAEMAHFDSLTDLTRDRGGSVDDAQDLLYKIVRAARTVPDPENKLAIRLAVEATRDYRVRRLREAELRPNRAEWQEVCRLARRAAEAIEPHLISRLWEAEKREAAISEALDWAYGEPA